MLDDIPLERDFKLFKPVALRHLRKTDPANGGSDRTS